MFIHNLINISLHAGPQETECKQNVQNEKKLLETQFTQLILKFTT
jgi:hypothetical protein